MLAAWPSFGNTAFVFSLEHGFHEAAELRQGTHSAAQHPGAYEHGSIWMRKFVAYNSVHVGTVLYSVFDYCRRLAHDLAEDTHRVCRCVRLYPPGFDTRRGVAVTTTPVTPSSSVSKMTPYDWPAHVDFRADAPAATLPSTRRDCKSS